MTELLDLSENAVFPEERSRLRKFPKNGAMRVAGRIAAFLNRIAGGRTSAKLGILTYHRVAEHIAGLPAPLHNVSPARFREQIQGLLDRGFEFWPLRRVLECHRNGCVIPSGTVTVTFDDGFASVYTEAFATLREFSIPATVFINTGYIDGDDPFPFDAWGVAHQQAAPAEAYRPLSTEECLAMQASGLVEIGAHTHTHADHRGYPGKFRKDVQLSVDIVRERFSCDEVPFAFPFGGRHTGFASDELIEAAKQTDVLCGLTTEPFLSDVASDPFLWGRFNVFPWDTSVTLAAKLCGWYSWAPGLSKLVACQVRVPLRILRVLPAARLESARERRGTSRRAPGKAQGQGGPS